MAGDEVTSLALNFPVNQAWRVMPTDLLWEKVGDSSRRLLPMVSGKHPAKL